MRIELPLDRPTPEWHNYCVYSGRHLPESAMSTEHVVPRSLGGAGATVIRCSKAVNSRLGHEIDGKVANDPMIIFGRRDADARGNSRRKPRAILKRAVAWKDGEPWKTTPPRYNIEVPRAGPASVYDTRTGQYLPQSTFATTGFIIPDMKIDNHARARFVAKTLLGLGWKIFGKAFLATGQTDSLRSMIGIATHRPHEQHHLYYLDPFTLEANSPARGAFQILQERVTQAGRTTALLRHTEFGIEWSVSCLGYFVGSLIYPVQQRLLPDYTPPGGGLLMTIESERLVFDVVDPFPAPWGAPPVQAADT